MSDIYIIAGIMTLFISLGLIIPFVDIEYGTITDIHTTDIKGAVTDDAENNNTLTTVYKVLLSIVSMFFWTFGALPLWLDTLFLILRITFFVTIARQFVGSGG